MLRAGQGAHFCIAIHEDVDLPAWASGHRASGGEVIAAVATGGSLLYETPLGGRIALAIGNEGAGLVSIAPCRGDAARDDSDAAGVESLNAGAATAVCLFECVRQRTPPTDTASLSARSSD